MMPHTTDFYTHYLYLLDFASVFHCNINQKSTYFKMIFRRLANISRSVSALKENLRNVQTICGGTCPYLLYLRGPLYVRNISFIDT